MEDQSEYEHHSMADFEPEEEPEEEAERPFHRVRHYKKEDVMLAECESFVAAHKRLPILHSRWLLNRYVNSHNFAVAHIPANNRMVDELHQAHRTITELKQRIAELER